MPDQEQVITLNPESLIAYGSEIKALGDGKVGGYLIRFSTPEDPDLTGDFFSKDTEYGPNTNPPLFYHHGMDGTLKTRMIGTGGWKIDDVGLWYEAQLAMRDEYEQMLYQMVEAGKMGYSSGALSHLVERESVGKAYWIKTWIIGEASLTPTPAEPRNSVMPLKSLGENIPLTLPDQKATAEADEQPARSEEKVIEAVKSNNLETEQSESEEHTMADITMSQEQLDGLVLATWEKAQKALPAESQEKTEIKVIKDESEQPFKSIGEFFMAVKEAGLYPARENVKLRSLKATGMSEGIPADGGYLVPEQTASGIVERMLEGGQILPRVSMDPVTGNSMKYNGVDETTHVGSVFGGVVGYWLEEGGTITASRPKFYKVNLELKKIAALCYATDEQLEDTANLAGWLNRNVPEALRWYVESAIISGDGVGRPYGITQCPALVSVLREDVNEINPSDFAYMWARRYTGVRDYVWLINPTVSAWMNTMAVGNVPVYMPQGSMAGSPDYGTLYGAPVIESEHVAAVKSAGDVLLCSLSQYQAISKGGVQAASSIHVAFTTAEQAFRFIYRIDGAPLWHSALTPENGSTISPFLSLAAASS